MWNYFFSNFHFQYQLKCSKVDTAQHLKNPLKGTLKKDAKTSYIYLT
jgi:hypothetical protein